MTEEVPPSGKQPARKPNCIDKFNKAVNDALEKVFESLGRQIGRRPILVIVGALIVSAILGSGIMRLETETRGEKLWVPTDNESQRNNEFVQANFPSLARVQFVYLEREDGGDVLTPEAFNFALSVHNDIVALEWDNLKDQDDPALGKMFEYLPATQSLKDLCFNRQGGEGAEDVLDCTISNALELFGYDSTAWADRTTLLATLNVPALWNNTLTNAGTVLDTLVGGTVRNADGDLTSGKVLAMQYLLASNKTLEDAQEDDEVAKGWEALFLERMEELDIADRVWHVRRVAARSFDDEFSSTINADLQLLQIALIAIVVFTYVAISNWQDGCVGSRLLLTLGGILNIFLAVVASYGFASYIGLLFTPLMSILPFIMLGVGVDGMFVLQGALDSTSREYSMEDRMGETMRTGGLSVGVASVTNFGAFMIGSNTTLPALSAFSIYAALGLLFNLFLQITFFSAVMCIDKRRQERRKFDVALCFTSSGQERSGYCCGVVPTRHEEGVRVRVMRWLGRQYVHKPVKAVVIVVWLGALAAGIYGTSQMRVDADVNNFIPEDSYLRDWINTIRTNFVQTGTSVGLYWVNDEENGKPLNFSDPIVQNQMDESLDLFRDKEFVRADTIDSWWEVMKGEDGNHPEADFYPQLREFLETPAGTRYLGEFSFVDEDPTKDIIAARSNFRWRYISETSEQIDAMVSMRATTATIPAPLGTNSFTHADEYLNIEQYQSIGREALLNIGLGFLMIAIVVLLLVANPVAAVLTFVCVASAIIELVGFMYFRGTFIDSISVIFLVISLGLAVDYSVHVAHGYLSLREDNPALRLEKTMGMTGAAVLNGVISTLIAALCLAGSGTYVFITFFFALLIIVVCGAFQGLVVLPVLLDTFRPAPHSNIATQIKEESAAGAGKDQAEGEKEQGDRDSFAAV